MIISQLPTALTAGVPDRRGVCRRGLQMAMRGCQAGEKAVILDSVFNGQYQGIRESRSFYRWCLNSQTLFGHPTAQGHDTRFHGNQSSLLSLI